METASSEASAMLGARSPAPDEAKMLLAEEQCGVPGPGDASLISVTELPGFASAKDCVNPIGGDRVE